MTNFHRARMGIRVAAIANAFFGANAALFGTVPAHAESPANTEYKDAGLYGVYCRMNNGLQFIASKQVAKVGHLLETRSDMLSCVDVRRELERRHELKPDGDLLRQIFELKKEIKTENAAQRTKHPQYNNG